MAQSVVTNRYSAFKASHDVSKSHTMSRLALWWIDVHPPGEAFVVTTAPTTPQVEAILWRYMGNAHRTAVLPGRITLDARWYIGDELVAYGRKPADYDPAAFQGIHARTMTTAGHIARATRDIDDEQGKNDWVRATIDVPGVGGGVVDRLAELELPVVPYNGGEAPIDKERFVNARAEDYWMLRERFEQGEIDIDPDDDKLAAQLGSIKWGIDSRGRIKIESKDDMRKRGLPSPDRADAMAIAFAGRVNAAPMNVESHAGESITGT
jgi:hypothetical protein